MARIFFLLAALLALPAHGQGFLEKLIDKHIEKQGESWKRETIETLATGRDPAERLKAAEALSGRNDPESIAALAGALTDADARVRLAAASGLWRLEKAAEPARAQLLKALDDADPNVAARAAGALQVLGVKPAELVAARQRIFNAPDAAVDTRFLVSRSLHGLEPSPRLLEAMVAFAEQSARGYTGSVGERQHHNVDLAEKALERLVKLSRDRALIALLLEALANAKHAQVSLMKTLAVFNPKPEGMAQALVAQLDSPQPHVRQEALARLRDVKSEKDIAVWMPRVAALLQDKDGTTRWRALDALGNAGGLASGEIGKVVAALGDPDPSVRRTAARVIGEIGEQSQAITAADKARVATLGRPALATAMEKDENAEVRNEAKAALAKLVPGSVAAAAPASAASTPASAASTSGGSEAAGMAVLRARNVKFEEWGFHRALSQMDVEVVRAFLDAGMSPETPSRVGPPLRFMLFGASACSPGVRPTKAETKEIVQLLLARGADVNAADENGNTPLMEAASKGCDRELIRTLIKAGAKITAKNSSGLTPFEMGLWMGHDGLEELLAAGYRLPPDKVKGYLEGYKDRPAALAMVRKAARK